EVAEGGGGARSRRRAEASGADGRDAGVVAPRARGIGRSRLAGWLRAGPAPSTGCGGPPPRFADEGAAPPSDARRLHTVGGVFAVAEEALLPVLLRLIALADERREDRDVEEQPVEEARREAERLDEIDEEHDADLVAVVPRLVLEGIVENERLALFPVAGAVGDADADPALLGLRHDQTEVEAEHAVIGAAVRGQVLARLEDREHRRLEAGNLLEDAPGLRTGGDRCRGSVAVTGDHESLPVTVGRDVGDFLGDLMEAGQLVLAEEQAVEFPADQRPLCLNV